MFGRPVSVASTPETARERTKTTTMRAVTTGFMCRIIFPLEVAEREGARCLEVVSDRSLTRNRGELLHHSNDGEIKEKADGKHQRHVRQPSIAIFIANKGCAIVHN